MRLSLYIKNPLPNKPKKKEIEEHEEPVTEPEKLGPDTKKNLGILFEQLKCNNNKKVKFIIKHSPPRSIPGFTQFTPGTLGFTIAIGLTPVTCSQSKRPTNLVSQKPANLVPQGSTGLVREPA